MAIRIYNKNLPESINKIKKMTPNELRELWDCYFIGGIPLAKPLWYKIMCDETGLTIEQKHITRLNTYAKDPNGHIAKAYKHKYHLKSGSQVEKRFKGKQHLIQVCPDGRFYYNKNHYNTLSAIAFVICGHKVSGNNFFGLNNKNGGVVHEQN